ncbi:DUF892 family protein [Larkinella punicea]|uniref:DUF892 family protein n=1 Tax=Larkinella punicea TaxID=2315727 RepID=A0A368JSC6_9BACT|nr:DUF892 family protein [Larkinella punicea]RCR70538.1 DUF892 family protein [Larkinella punicea]
MLTFPGSKAKSPAQIQFSERRFWYVSFKQHLKMAVSKGEYGTLRMLAGGLGYSKAAELLEQTLAEENKTDAHLTEIAEDSVNESAKQE